MRAKLIRSIAICLIGLLSLSLATCSSNPPSGSLPEESDWKTQELDTGDPADEEGKEQFVVFASFYPIYDLSSLVIGKEDVVLRCFMPPAQDPHLWEPTPRDIKNLSEADLLIINGANMEERWLGSVRESLPGLDILTLSDSVELITYKGAAALGDFQYLSKIQLQAGRVYPIEFGHTHQDLMRVAFFRSDRTEKDDIIAQAKKIMEAKGKLVAQAATIEVKEGEVYGIEMGHTSGIVYYEVPEDGDYYFVSDRLSEPILSYVLQTPGREELAQELVLSGSTSGLDKLTYDPHSWMSVVNAKSYLNSINMKLAEKCPDLRNRFNKNKVKAVTSLTNLEFEYRKKFSSCSKNSFVTTHYAYAYLARDFDLVQWPLQGLTSMQDPSLKTISKAIYYCQAKGIHIIFYESNTASKGADAIAAEIGGKTLPLNSMEYSSSTDNLSYLDIMRDNLEKLYQAMR